MHWPMADFYHVAILDVAMYNFAWKGYFIAVANTNCIIHLKILKILP